MRTKLRQALSEPRIAALLGILSVALALRLWGIGFGLPYQYHYDEHFYINTALKLGAGVLHNPPYAATGLSNILFGEYAGYYITSKLLGGFASAQQFETAFRSDPTLFYLLGRLTTAVLGTATILALYLLGKIVATPTTGLIAAGFLAVSFLHVRDSHYAVPDIIMPFFAVLAVTLAAAGIHHNRLRYIYLASLAGGLAVAMKWTGLPVAMPVWWAGACIGTSRREIGKLLNRTAFPFMFFFALGFALGSPQILINPSPYLREALGQYGAGQTGGFEIWQVDIVPGWLFYLKTLSYGLGIVLLALAILGFLGRLVSAVRTRDRVSILLLSFPLLYFLLMGSTRHYFARYALPLAPFMALFAAEAVAAAAGWMRAKQGARLGWGLKALPVVVAIVQPLACSIRHDILLTRQDTRTLAKQWIDANIGEGAKIAVDWPVHGPPLSTPERAAPNSERVYDVTIVGGTGLADHPIEWYREQGFDYLIASSFIYQIPLVFPEQDRVRRAFYESLGRELTEVQVFSPTADGSEPDFVFDEIYGPAVSLWQRERPGPTIKIYRVFR